MIIIFLVKKLCVVGVDILEIRLFRPTVLILLSTILSACIPIVQHTPVPEEFVEQATIPELGTVRTWADDISPQFVGDIKERHEQVRKAGNSGKTMHFLALSGGGQNGAFGAGVLNGWSKKGARPEFELVTGVSTGALIAPFAYLGKDYDNELESFYTTVSASDIYRPVPAGIFVGAALADNRPLAEIIKDVVDEEFLAEIARQHGKGRRLFVVTTNIEAQRPVLWNLSKIATYQTLQSQELFRSVLLASAAIPGAFPPVPIEVVAGGRSYTELHVDGGTTTNNYIGPLNVSLPPASYKRRGQIHAIQDGKLSPAYQEVDPKTLKLAGRGISTVMKYKSYGDTYRLRLYARQKGYGFRMMSIPDSFDAVSENPFDTVYMNQLYDLGYSFGKTGRGWTSNPNIF